MFPINRCKAILTIAAVLVSTTMVGCASVTWSADIGVDCQLGGAGNSTTCSASAHVHVQSKVSNVMDPNQLLFDVSTSNLSFSATAARVTVQATQNGVVIASNQFEVYRSGNRVGLSDPYAVQQWIASVENSTDNTFQYSLNGLVFNATTSELNATASVTVTQSYAGQVGGVSTKYLTLNPSTSSGYPPKQQQ